MNSSWGSRIIFIINNGCGIWSLKKKFKEYRFRSKVYVLDGLFNEVHFVQLNEAYILYVLKKQCLHILKQYFWIRHTSLSRCGMSKNPGWIFSDGFHRTTGDPYCFLRRNKVQHKEASTSGVLKDYIVSGRNWFVLTNWFCRNICSPS